MRWIQRRAVEPRLPGGRGTGAVIDLRPAWSRGRTRDIVRAIVHERHQVGGSPVGAARRTERRDIAIGKVGWKIMVQILTRGAQKKTRILGGTGTRRGSACHDAEQSVPKKCRGPHRRTSTAM